MTLESKLAKIREGAAERIPKETRELMARATQELRESGALDRIASVGDRLPPFALENRDGTTVRSEDLLARGPLVVSVFRGSW